MENKEKEMARLKEKFLNFYKKDSLYQKGTQPVFGEGHPDAKIILIGEAPGHHESLTGHPFCGTAGKILDELLESIGIKRKDIYITNLIKLRPPNNREPRVEEIRSHGPYLEKQIEIIKPKVICPLGNYSTQYIFKEYGLSNIVQGISKIHGKIFSTKTHFNSFKIVPLYHPAVAVYNPKMKEVLKKDFRILQKINAECSR